MAEVEIPERYEARRLLDAVQAGALLLEPLSGRVLYANQAALALLGLAASQVLGRSLAELGALRALDGSPVMGIGPLSGEVELLAVRHQGPCVPVLASCRECGGSGAAGLVLTLTHCESLSRARERYTSFFDNAVEGIFQSSPDGHFLSVNPALAGILGFSSPSEMIEAYRDLRAQLYVDSRDRDRLLRILRRDGQVTNFETRFYCKDGSIKWINIAVREVRGGNGEVLYIEGLNIDITARKEAQAALVEMQRSLSESEDKFRLTFDQSPIGASMLALDLTIFRVNQTFCKITGYCEAELLGRNILEITHPDDVVSSSELASRLSAGGLERYEIDKRYLHKEGHDIWVRLSVGLVRDACGTALYYLPMVQDITKRKLAEADLASAKARLSHLLTNAPAIIYSRKPTAPHSLNFISQNVKFLVGFEPESLLERDFWLSRIHPEDAGSMPADRTELYAEDASSFEYRFRNKDGDYVFLREQYRWVRGEDGQAQEIVGFLTDVTARRSIMDALEKSEARYRAIVEDQSELLCRFAPDGTLTFVNEAYAKYFGKSKDELLGSKFVPLLPKAERLALDRHLAGLTPLSPLASIDHSLFMPDGTERWHHRSDRALFSPSGEVTEYQCVVRDVTERVRAQAELTKLFEEKEHLRLNLEAVFRSIPDAIIVVDTQMNVIQTNRALAEVCLVGPEVSPGKPLRLVSGACRRACFTALSSTLQTREPVLEYRVECKGRAPGRTVIINSTPLLSRSNQFVGAVLVIRDITRLADLEKRLTDLHGHRGLIGKSKVMRDIYAVLDQLSEVDSTVLISGESGTGKELVAEALHFGGHRAKGPLVKVNCSALSEGLLESELFGHVRGAFTGATRDKIGRFEAAEGGTIFLDEIGDISPRIQLNLLRVLERKEFERVGDSNTRRANVRVLAATNADLKEKIRLGLFREDLYYRLKVMPVILPPLRERSEDIPLLIEHFINLFRAGFGKNLSRCTDEVMRLLMTYSWPGNVRELRYALEHACILSPGPEIGPEHLPPELCRSALSGVSFGLAAKNGPAQSRGGLGREAIIEALAKSGGNRAKAARLLGVNRRTLYRNLDKYSLS